MRKEKDLDTRAICAALNHLSGSEARARFAGVADVARDLEKVGEMVGHALKSSRPEVGLAILVTGVGRASLHVDRIVRRLAALPAAGVRL